MDLEVVLLFCLAINFLIVWVYTLGLRHGQKLAKKEEITLPEVNPIKVISKKREKYEDKKEQEEWNEYLEAVEAYDGRL